MEATENDYDNNSDIYDDVPVTGESEPSEEPASNTGMLRSESKDQNLRPGRNDSESESNDIELVDTVAKLLSGILSQWVLLQY